MTRSWMLKLCGFLAAGAVAMMLTGPAARAEGNLETVKLRFGWTYGGQFSPLYLGKDKGFFAEEGIDLQLLEGKGSVPSATAVANGTDDFGYLDVGAVAKLIDKGLPVRGIAQIRQKTTMGILSLADKGLAKPSDLVGHMIGFTPGDSTSQLFPAFAAASGIDASKVQHQGLDYSVYLKALVNGQIDAIGGYRDWEGFTLENEGHAINMILFSDNGANVLDYGFITSQKLISEKPDLVKRFVAAAVRSFTYAADHPDEAVAAGQKYFPEFDAKLAIKQVTYQNALFGDSVKQGKPIGWIDPATWQNTLNLLHQYMGVQNTDPSAYFTNDFIPTK